MLKYLIPAGTRVYLYIKQPKNGLCSADWNIEFTVRDVEYDSDEFVDYIEDSWYVFRLPQNTKGLNFLLVDKEDVLHKENTL